MGSITSFRRIFRLRNELPRKFSALSWTGQTRIHTAVAPNTSTPSHNFPQYPISLSPVFSVFFKSYLHEELEDTQPHQWYSYAGKKFCKINNLKRGIRRTIGLRISELSCAMRANIGSLSPCWAPKAAWAHGCVTSRATVSPWIYQHGSTWQFSEVVLRPPLIAQQQNGSKGFEVVYLRTTWYHTTCCRRGGSRSAAEGCCGSRIQACECWNVQSNEHHVLRWPNPFFTIHFGVNCITVDWVGGACFARQTKILSSCWIGTCAADSCIFSLYNLWGEKTAVHLALCWWILERRDWKGHIIRWQKAL